MGDSCQSEDSFISSNNDPSYVPSENDDSDCSTNSTGAVVKTLPARERRKPDRYGYSNLCAKMVDVDTTELSLEQALQGEEKEHWLRAVQEELQCFYENNAWELVDPPKSGTIVKCKWVLKKNVIVKITFVIVRD